MHSMELKQNVTRAWFLCPICGSHCKHPVWGRTLAARYRFLVTVWHDLEMPRIYAKVSVLLLPAIVGSWWEIRLKCVSVPVCCGAGTASPPELARGGLTSDKPRWREELVSGINIICKQLSSYCSFRAVLRSKGSLQSVISPITIKIY